MGALLALGLFGDAVLRIAQHSPAGPTKRIMRAAAVLVGLGLGVEIVIWALVRFGSSAGRMAEAALIALILWAAGRAVTWFGLFTLLQREGRPPAAPLAAVVPLLAGLRLVLFVAQLFAPYLEAGGHARELFLSTESLRSWVAFGLAVVCDLAIAWLAGRAARA